VSRRRQVILTPEERTERERYAEREAERERASEGATPAPSGSSSQAPSRMGLAPLEKPAKHRSKWTRHATRERLCPLPRAASP
jgi:hypothetical protein